MKDLHGIKMHLEMATFLQATWLLDYFFVVATTILRHWMSVIEHTCRNDYLPTYLRLNICTVAHISKNEIKLMFWISAELIKCFPVLLLFLFYKTACFKWLLKVIILALTFAQYEIAGRGCKMIPFRTVIATKMKYLMKILPEGQCSICTTQSSPWTQTSHYGNHVFPYTQLWSFH